MKPRLSVILFMSVLLLAVGTAAVACDGNGDGGGGGNGGGGELTLEEYFQEFEAISQDVNERFEALEEEFGPGEEFASEEDQVEASRGFLEAIIPVLRDAFDQVDDMDPPAEVEDAHNEFVDSGAGFLEASLELTDQLADVQSASELEEAFDNPEREAADDRFMQACSGLQGIADDNGIDVDLECGDVAP